jgi:hypothetical protein
MRWLIFFMTAFVGAAWASPGFAWGPSGHRTVCEIALRNLTPTAKAEVTRLLQVHPIIPVADPQTKQLGWACDYPDRTVPGGPTRRDPEHFVNYPRDTQALTLQSGCGAAHECVVNSILTDLALLRSPFIADRHRAVALMYLGHWVGDIHQPLHNSFGDDKGGGDIRTSGLCTQGLHNAWDTCIIQRKILNMTGDPSIPTLETLATTWSAQVTDTDRAKWLSSPPWVWSQESYEITIRPAVGYCVMVGTACQYSATQPTFTGTGPRTVVVDGTYATMAAPIILQRITQAGIRLAHLINLALDPAYRQGF